MKKKSNGPSCGPPPPITFPFNNHNRPFICFSFHTATPSPQTLSIFIHTSQTQPPPPPINSSPRPFPLTAASFSPVNKLGLFSDDHSLNLERNCHLCEVAKLLLLPDLLQSIASIKADYIAQVDERTQFGKEIGIIVPVSDS